LIRRRAFDEPRQVQQMRSEKSFLFLFSKKKAFLAFLPSWPGDTWAKEECVPPLAAMGRQAGAPPSNA
jgi:hypothetical protein